MKQLNLCNLNFDIVLVPYLTSKEWPIVNQECPQLKLLVRSSSMQNSW